MGNVLENSWLEHVNVVVVVYYAQDDLDVELIYDLFVFIKPIVIFGIAGIELDVVISNVGNRIGNRKDERIGSNEVRNRKGIGVVVGFLLSEQPLMVILVHGSTLAIADEVFHLFIVGRIVVSR